MEFDRIASQCPAKMQYHIDSYALIVQFLDKNGDAHVNFRRYRGLLAPGNAGATNIQKEDL